MCESGDRLSRLEQKLELLEAYSIEAFWVALDRAYEVTLRDRELVCIVCGVLAHGRIFLC